MHSRQVIRLLGVRKEDIYLMQSKNRVHANRIKYVAKIGVLAAVAFLLMLLEFPLSFIAPAFYELDLSEVVVFIGSFALGPLAGVLIELLKNLLNILITGSTTAYVGEFANFVTGCALVLPAAWLYKYKKSRAGALWGMLLGTVCLATVGGLMNYFVLVPTFSKLYELPIEAIVSMGRDINPAITDLPRLIVFAVVPFNVLKGVLVSAITFLLYKRVAPILKNT